jgi:hypothetical protein
MKFAKRLFFIVLFLSILTEATTTSLDPWSGSFSWYFHADLKSWLPQSGIPFNPFEVTIAVIFIAWALRGRRDQRFHFEKGLLYRPIMAFIIALIFSLLWGAMQPGGDFTVALWEVRSFALAIIAYFLIGILFTHRRDLDTLTWVILVAALLMGIECIIRYEFFIPGHAVGDLDYDHEDATLLACALVLSIAMLLLGSTRRQKIFVLISLPINALAMMVTYRRAGEAALAIGMVFLALILLRVNRPLFMKIVPVTALILSLYVGLEWNCTSGAICQPARAISSQFNPDPRDAASNDYRYIEKFDLVQNIQANPITGVGFGQPFVFYIQLPDLSFWEFWHYTPHNEILWIWTDMGIIGFVVFWWLIASSLYRSGRLTQALSAAGDYKARALLAAAACLIVMQMSVSYVDLGFTSDRAMLLFGIMLGVIGHLPGILRRSTNTDIPTRSKAGDDGLAKAIEKETPEVQVGMLAHALIAAPEAPDTRRDPWSQQRQNQAKRAEARWGQNNGHSNGNHQNGVSGMDHTSRPIPDAKPRKSRPLSNAEEQRRSRPLSRAEEQHRSHPLMSDRSTTPASATNPYDELPWVTRSRE